jgi:hypothetical protein
MGRGDPSPLAQARGTPPATLIGEAVDPAEWLASSPRLAPEGFYGPGRSKPPCASKGDASGHA